MLSVPKKSKFPVMRTTWPRIIDYRKSKLSCFMVDGRRRRGGKREYFQQLPDAKTRADQLAVERENHGTAALNFPERDRVMAVECRELLAPWNCTIRDAAVHYVAHLKAEAIRSKSPLIRECVEYYIAARQEDVQRGDLAERSLSEAGYCVKQLASVVGELRIINFDADRLKTYIDSFPVSARTRSNLRLRLSGFLSFCKSKKWISLNPCTEFRVKVPKHEVTILTVADAEYLLSCAEASKFRNVLVPYVALCLFGGLRPFEAQGLDWSNVDFETNHIHVLAHTSKKREGRYVRMEPTLIRWLKPFAKSSGRICGVNFRKQWESLIKAAGYSADKPWPQDVMRHTAASMLLTIKRNRALVAEELGTSVEVLRRHYRQPLSKAVAKRFWALSPVTAPHPSDHADPSQVESKRTASA
jgi:integrase